MGCYCLCFHYFILKKMAPVYLRSRGYFLFTKSIRFAGRFCVVAVSQYFVQFSSVLEIIMKLGDIFPDFSAETTEGEVKFHNWMKDSWAVLFAHPADFTPVCTTELGEVAKLSEEFKKRNVKLIALSCDDVESHLRWIEDIKSYACLKGAGFPFPIISDKKRDLAVSLGMIDPDEKDKDGLPLTCRAVFIVGPDRRMKLSMLYPASTGRNFNEVLRVVDSLQLTYNKNVATPVNWQAGGDCMVLPNIKDEDLPTLFPKGVTVKEVPSKKSYIRITPQP